MLKKIPLLIFLLSFYFGFAQSDTVAIQKINAIIAQSGGHLRKLECDKSLKLARIALEKAFEIDNNELIARSYNIIGLNMDEYYDFKKAIYFFNNGLKYANKTQSDFIRYSLHTNIARTYCFRKIDFKKGILNYKKGLFYSKLLKDDYEIMYANLNIATAYFAINDYKNGYPYLKSAEIAVNSGDELESKISFYSLLGAYYSNKNNFIDAEKAYLKALEFCGENKTEFLEDNATEVYDDISRMYSMKGDFKKAYFYMEKYNVLKEKQFNEEHSKLEKTVAMGTVLDEYKRKISTIEDEKNKQLEYLSQTKKIGVFVIVLFLIFILLTVTLFQNFKTKKKINKELLTINSNLEIAKQQAEEVSNLKMQFVSKVSHELRTPLYGVVGITNIISEKHAELEDSPYLKALKFSSNHLLSLVNDILQFNKMESQKIILENSIFDLNKEVNTFLFSLQFLANKNNNEIICEIDEKIPKLLIGDRLRLSQILINLISNSLKFTNNGKIKISANLVGNDAKFHQVRFEVSDNGIGIAENDQMKIFDSFVQLNSEKSDFQGTGLGLSIVQKLIELFESKIFLESKVGEGTSIHFTIAFEEAVENVIEFYPNTETEYSSNVLNILLVEDNLINQMVSKKIIENFNYKCTIANDGFEAIAILNRAQFDIILMDINMPKMNGYEAAMEIRNLKINTPIIALTAFSEKEVNETVFASGMNAIISKPFKPSELRQTIINQLYKTKNAE